MTETVWSGGLVFEDHNLPGFEMVDGIYSQDASRHGRADTGRI
jgi:hypothetical protein